MNTGKENPKKDKEKEKEKITREKKKKRSTKNQSTGAHEHIQGEIRERPPLS